MRWILSALAITALLHGAASDKAADLTLRDLDGNRVRLRDFRGKVVVLNFWATWCEPCRDELPMLVRTEKELRSRGVVFVGASLDERETRSRIPDFLKRFGVEFLVWTGASADDLDRLKLGGTVPATAFLDREGRIAARVSGEVREQELRERVEWVLGDRTGPAPEAFISHLPR